MVGRIAPVLNVVGTNFASFFVTFFDNSLFVVETKVLQTFSKKLKCRKSCFPTLTGKTINIRKKPIAYMSYLSTSVPALHTWH